MPTRSVKVGDIEISYTEQGEGYPLILLHGGLATADLSWTSRYDALQQTYRVLAPDSRGHGRTTNPSGRLSYDQMADDVVAFAAAVGAEKPLVLGFSDGGQVGIEIGLRHPDFAKALVLGGTIIEPTPAYIEGIGKAGFLGPDKVDFDRLGQSWGPFLDMIKANHVGDGSPDYWRTLVEQIATLWLTVPSYSADQLGRISTPALVITGDRDDLTDHHQAVRLFDALPDAELAILPNADHSAVDLEPFWMLALDFLDRKRTGRAPVRGW